MKLCIVSDSHDRSELLAAAVAEAKAEGAEAVIHCGDVIGPNTLRGLLPLGLPVHVIHGNNLGDPVAMARLAAASGSVIRYHGGDARLELAGHRVFVVHYPDYGEAMATTGEWHLVCCGHSHQAEIRRVRNVKGGLTLLVNPGTVAGIGAPATYALGDLDRLEFAIRPVPR
ncbi:metallophosphoesterase family protein [Pelomicrobium methylotrophicum]|uniref:Metallophosphoesterase family protein n=1 Tax=Pelomicrobium methylotrophicum TaxID=2602750 RepID=A0A5C7EK32_9PROT|nr:metallophosphoesterase family protein [Pelomicrobium methylotrophicum]TXF11373.1 metallophosphoesterase family protein [Pelomicrobium methylotrophicum]